MMDRPDFDAFCASLPATFMVEQWGEAHVWKVGSDKTAKVFALSSHWGLDAPGRHDSDHAVIFKVMPMSFEMLTQEEGIGQAPYMAKGHWVQVLPTNPLQDEDLKAYIRSAHRIMAGKLTKKLQGELNLLDWVKDGAA